MKGIRENYCVRPDGEYMYSDQKPRVELNMNLI